MNMPEEEHPTDQELPASIRHIIISILTSVVGVIERAILLYRIQLIMATGSIQVI